MLLFAFFAFHEQCLAALVPLYLFGPAFVEVLVEELSEGVVSLVGALGELLFVFVFLALVAVVEPFE